MFPKGQRLYNKTSSLTWRIVYSIEKQQVFSTKPSTQRLCNLCISQSQNLGVNHMNGVHSFFSRQKNVHDTQSKYKKQNKRDIYTQLTVETWNVRNTPSKRRCTACQARCSWDRCIRRCSPGQGCLQCRRYHRSRCRERRKSSHPHSFRPDMFDRNWPVHPDQQSGTSMWGDQALVNRISLRWNAMFCT